MLRSLVGSEMCIRDRNYIVEDGCGNFSDVTYTIETKDCKAPTAYCIFRLSIDLMPSGIVEIWATDFDAGSYDECASPIIVSFDEAGTQFSTIFTCDDIGTNNLNIWVTDANGNSAYCTTFVVVQPNPNADGSIDDNCSGNGFLSGKIQTEYEDDIGEVLSLIHI